MPAFDRVQVMPGHPRLFTVEVGTGWETLPDVSGCIGVFLRPRSDNTETIYIADLDLTNGASPGDLNRTELEATDRSGITYAIDSPARLQVAAASGTQKLEVHCIFSGGR